MAVFVSRKRILGQTPSCDPCLTTVFDDQGQIGLPHPTPPHSTSVKALLGTATKHTRADANSRHREMVL